MGKLSVFGNFASLLIIILSFVGMAHVDKLSVWKDIFLYTLMLGPLMCITAFILGIIAMIKNKQRGWGIAGFLIGFSFMGLIVLFAYFAMKGLAGFR